MNKIHTQSLSQRYITPKTQKPKLNCSNVDPKLQARMNIVFLHFYARKLENARR
jgi:hypothetical protein